jgi:hypothetical protein
VIVLLPRFPVNQTVVFDLSGARYTFQGSCAYRRRTEGVNVVTRTSRKERHMRLGIAFVAALAVAAISGIAIAPVLAQGDAVIELSVGQDDPALEWDIDVAGGTSSANHLTLAPISLGFRGEVTVAIDGSSASVTFAPALPVDMAVASVGCLDDGTPPIEIEPVVDGTSFTLDVVPGRRYSCFATSLPSEDIAPVAPIAGPTQASEDKPLPRSDSALPPQPAAPGWLAVVLAIIAVGGAALVLRPVRR